MAKIYESIKGLISQDMITSAAETLNEPKEKVSLAAGILIPTLLGKLLQRGNSEKTRTVAELAGKMNILNEKEKIFQGHGVIDNVNVGERMENVLLGTNGIKTFSAVASASEMDKSNLNRLSNWVSALIAGYLGDRIVNKNDTLPAILSELGDERPDMRNNIPPCVFQGAGLAGTFGEKPAEEESKGKKKKGWILWLILLLLLLLFFLMWRSCSKKQQIEDKVASTIEKVEGAVENAIDTLKGGVDGIVGTDGIVTSLERRNAGREKKEITLPSGQEITGYEKGVEENLVAYLNSKEFKDGKAGELESGWFPFDNIDFVHSSSNELVKGSQAQLDNLTAILKEYSDAKIKVGGFADKTGPEWANKEMSEERAEFIKKQFVGGGIDAERISTEGFGSEQAKADASAPEAERVIDRHIALQISK